MGAARIYHPGKKSGEVPRLGSCELRGDLHLVHLAADGADQTAAKTRVLQNLLEQIGHGGLAVGSGHRDQFELVRRIAEIIMAEQRIRPPGIRTTTSCSRPSE